MIQPSTANLNPCGALPIVHNNQLVPYHEFVSELAKVYAAQQEPKIVGQTVDQMGLPIIHDGASASGHVASNATITGGTKGNNQFCLVQTKAKLNNEL